MKFSAAAVFFLGAGSVSEAFAPSKSTFGVSKNRISRLHSTTDDINISIQRSLLNGELDSSGTLPPSPQVKEIDPETAKRAAIETRAATAAYLSQYKGESGASIVYSKLQENGVEVVNGFSGGAVLPLLDQFHHAHPRHAASGKEPIRWITNSNESSSGHIAEGIAKSLPMGGEHLPVGVAVATSGPGVTNLITPMQDAICDGVPMVILCGQAATVAPKDAFQSSPAVDLTRPCTKWSYQIKSAAELPMAMDYAFFIARNGRPGPVFIDLPKDLLNQVLTADLIDSFVDKNLIENSDVQSDFVRLDPRHRENGVVFQSLRLGTPELGLPFEVKKSQDGKYGLSFVPKDERSDSYHADHFSTNRVFKVPEAVDGVEEVDELAVGSPFTKEMVRLISHAKKPIIIAGQGCNDSPEELKEFAEKLKIPVATTLHALGCFDERNDLALNMVGMHGHPTPNFMVQDSDLIICVGSRFDDRITGRMSDFIPEARKAAEEGRGGVIHVDIRVTEKCKQLSPTFFVHSKAKTFLNVMNQALKEADVKPVTDAWLEHKRELQLNYPVKVPFLPTEDFEVVGEDGSKTTVARTRSSAQSVISELDRQLLAAGKMDDAIFTTGVGIHQMVAAQLITWTQPRQMLSSGSLGTMGVSLGYSIGAKLANEKKIVVSIDGDGSFNMTFTELKTLAEQKIAVKIMILDNDGQMMVEYWQRLFHDNRLIAVRNSSNPDYCKLAGSFGIKSVYCDNEEELPAKMEEFLFAYPDEPVLFHVRIARTPCLPLVAPGQPLDDMILEDVEVEVDQSAAPS